MHRMIKIDSEPWLTLDEAAERTGVPAWRLRKWHWAGRLPASKPDGERGRTYVRASDVEAIMTAALTRAAPD